MPHVMGFGGWGGGHAAGQIIAESRLNRENT